MAAAKQTPPSEWLAQLEERKMREVVALRAEVAELKRCVEAALPRVREPRPALALIPGGDDV